MNPTIAFLATFQLFLGGMIYLLWRPLNLQMFSWIHHIGMFDELMAIRGACDAIAPSGWLLYSFPHASWTFAGTIFLALVWRNKMSKASLFWTSLIPLLSIAGEIGQCVSLVPGKFDPLDLLSIVAASVLAFLIICFHHRHPCKGISRVI